MKNSHRVLIGSAALAVVGMAGMAGAVGLAAGAVRYWRGKTDLRGRVVLITGGSRGLGLVLAREFGRQGARVMILARDQGELARAADDLRSRGVEVAIFTGDVTSPETATAAVAETVRIFGRLDVLVNNAGMIVVSPLANLTEADFEAAMGTHMWAPLRFMNAALPELRKVRGRIVNISSVGGKIAVPHMASYSASKFALAGLSEAYRAELAKDGVAVTSVFPGLLRTGSHIQAQFKGQQAKEFSWFALGSATPLTSISADRAARQIVRACRNGTAELVISVQARLAVLGRAVLPNVAAWVSGVVDRFLPAAGPEGPAGRGGDVRGAFPPKAMTWLPDQASAANNELATESEENAGTLRGSIAAD